MLDNDGSEHCGDYNRRLITISLHVLKGINRKLVPVDDAAKVQALLAAVHGGLASHLVITREVVVALLEETGNCT